LGAIPPQQFIPVAEESGLIADTGDWVLQRACRDIRTWLDQGIAVPRIAVNMSPLQFRDAAWVHRVKDILNEARVPPQYISLEVTESALMDDVNQTELMLRELKSFGIQLSMDDFGTGYSSLSYLKRFPFDKVKIDQSFVRDVMTDPNNAVLVKVIIAMAHGLGIMVIAEGVETEDQCGFLRNQACDEIQGYFFSKPLVFTAITELLDENHHLPAHLIRLQKPKRTLLLVDDEPHVVASLKRLLRRDDLVILTANSGPEGLKVMAMHKVDVIISDQRMPEMTGVEFLRTVKHSYPDTIRIVLSGYTELQSVTDAINEGAIYRFLTKPWDDEQLKQHIHNAFESKELLENNHRLGLEIRSTNQKLVATNRQLSELLEKGEEESSWGRLVGPLVAGEALGLSMPMHSPTAPLVDELHFVAENFLKTETERVSTEAVNDD
jgi:EAL domain-containing protein (putative c-di-GMP-specific phosphodiesterase class I)/CheY-like chemotaxis protein